ncbi:MAG TPA: TrkH family potassium uptake protein, partial [Spirochaetia bacterium]|nr:TrkH family potassium uptake protein [Spirochaetia bacterium]
FLIAGLSSSAAGAGLWIIFRSPKPVISPAHGAIVIVVSWIVVCAVSAIPVMMLARVNFTLGFFESVSGWTTTGLSIVDVEKVPHILLLWRSIMQLAGGAGLAIVMLAAFSLPVGAGLYRAEGKGEQLVPNVVRSSKVVLTLYAAYAGLGIVGYLAAGMTPFDAINHTFAAISTGGFSTHEASIGFWDSPEIESVSIVLMILGNLNFGTAYLLVRGRAKPFFLNVEIRLFFFLLIVAIPVVLFFTTRAIFPDLPKAVRVAVFETISALTTTGFSTVSYDSWNGTGLLVLILLMIVGGGACSTAGGLKQYRVYLLWRSVRWEISKTILPRRVVHEHRVWSGEFPSYPGDGQFMQAGAFAFLYLGFYFAGALAMSAYGIPLKSALFEFASALGTVGLSVGVTSPSLPGPLIWLETAAMFFGRLEFFVVIGAFARAAMDIKRLFAGRR